MDGTNLGRGQNDFQSGLPRGVTRRNFVKTTMAAGVAVGAGAAHPGWAEETRKGEMIYRMLGRTGEQVSAIGLGGYHIGEPKDENESIKIIRTAIDRGINFLDNCWDYHDGGSEIRMGKALRDGYRDKVFLMTKIDGRTRESAAKQIDESLKRLQTDHIDLMQFHEIIRMEDPVRVFEGGAMDAMQDARRTGKIRFIGFTGHKDPRIHLKMLETAAIHKFRFDTVQMPLNVMDAHYRSFEHLVLPELLRDRTGVLGMKPMGGGVILTSNVVKPIECLHYALNLPTSVVITGIDSMQILEQAFEAARTFKPMAKAEVRTLLGRTGDAAAHGEYELFKTETRFDGTVQHPEWLG